MSFKELTVQRRYRSKDLENFKEALLLPALKQTKLYKRSIGLISSDVLHSLVEEAKQVSENDGIIQLIVSVNLSKKEIIKIEQNPVEREPIIGSAFIHDFDFARGQLSEEDKKLLNELIAAEVMEIKIAVTDENELHDEQLGIMTDDMQNTIVFYVNGSSLQPGAVSNYEKVRTIASWISGADLVDKDIEEFDTIWDGQDQYVDVFEYSKPDDSSLLKTPEGLTTNDSSDPVNLRDYQQEAVDAWINNGYNGFLVMATGTGKTWTALFAARELASEENVTVVIAAPYKHLIKQWAEDIEKLFISSTIVMVSSENPNWERQLTDAIYYKKYGHSKQLIVVSTIASFTKEKFTWTMLKDDSKKLLIVDEAHRFTERTEDVRRQYKYMLGLSATPYRGTSAASGKELMDYFGGRVYNLPIEEALKRKCLVGYYYKPIYVYATAAEEEQFEYYTSVMASCFVNDICIDLEKLVVARSNRLRIISMSEEKQSALDRIIVQISEEDELKDHLIVYCGDGKLYDENKQEIRRHIDTVKSKLNQMNYRASQFTARENIKERMSRINSFNNGTITALAAIRCLDEGVNIPSIKGALILSSNDDYREFVQRRGRILRTYPGKEYATIYDVIVLPGSYLSAWAKIELRRYYEYAKLAINANELECDLNDRLKQYSLTKDDINVFEFDVEDALDE